MKPAAPCSAPGIRPMKEYVMHFSVESQSGLGSPAGRAELEIQRLVRARPGRPIAAHGGGAACYSAPRAPG